MRRLLCRLGIHEWKASTNGGTSGNWIHLVWDCQRCGLHRFGGRRRRTPEERNIPVLSERQIDRIIAKSF